MAARCLCTSLTLNTSLSVHSEKKLRFIYAKRSLPAQLQTYKTNFTSTRPHGKLQICIAAVHDEDDGGGARSKKGQQLWRKELWSADEVSGEFESFDDEVRQRSTLERDIKRLTKKEEVEKLLTRALDGSKDEAVDQKGIVVRDVADKVLVADFFFILFSLAWLVAGLAERAALESSNLIDSWLPLWPLVFQPALGVFMAGAILSAVTKKK